MEIMNLGYRDGGARPTDVAIAMAAAVLSAAVLSVAVVRRD